MDYQEVQQFIRRHECACGNTLSYLKTGQGEYAPFCPGHPYAKEFVKLKSLRQAYEEGEAIPIFVKDRLERKGEQKLAEEYGNETGKTLAVYQGTTKLSKDALNFILAKVYPKAPEGERIKAMALCLTYGLNPLMNHVYLIPFDSKKTGETTWAMVLGMKAKRLIASRQGRYGYIDDTPRLMTDEEQRRIRGKVEPDRIWAITKLRDKDGLESAGYGFYSRHDTPHGTEKGNSAEHMAMLRSESQALDRLFPGEMPQGIEVMDEQFIEGEFKVEESPTTSEAPSHFCSVHNVPFQLKTGRSGARWWAHPLPGGKWCNEANIPLKETEVKEPLPEGGIEAESTTPTPDIPPAGMTKDQFLAKVQAVLPKWGEDFIGKVIGCPLDKWSEPFEVALDIVEQMSGKKIQ